jgi:hypothetical protein
MVQEQFQLSNPEAADHPTRMESVEGSQSRQTVKYDYEPRGTWNQNLCAGEGQ